VLVEGNPAAPDPAARSCAGLTTAIDGTFIARRSPAPTASAPHRSATGRCPGHGAGGIKGPTEAPDLVLPTPREVNGTLIHQMSNGTACHLRGHDHRLPRAATSALLQPIKLFETLTDNNGQFKVVLPRPRPDTSY